MGKRLGIVIRPSGIDAYDIDAGLGRFEAHKRASGNWEIAHFRSLERPVAFGETLDAVVENYRRWITGETGEGVREDAG